MWTVQSYLHALSDNKSNPSEKDIRHSLTLAHDVSLARTNLDHAHGATGVLCQRNIPGTRGVHAKYFSPRRPGSRTLKMSSITIEKGPEEKSSDQLFRLNLLISVLLAFRKELRETS